MHPVEAERDEARRGYELDVWVVEDEARLEISAIERIEAELRDAKEERPSGPGSRHTARVANATTDGKRK